MPQRILDLEVLGAKIYGEDFVKWILKQFQPNELLFRLAQDSGVVLLPGRGFGSPYPAGRVLVANLNETDYTSVNRSAS